MSEIIQPILIILAIIFGVGAIAYFYFSADIFMDILKRPLRMISAGMFAIDLGVILIAFIAYESSIGMDIKFFGMPLSTLFYILYFMGSIMVIFGSSKFTHRPSQTQAE